MRMEGKVDFERLHRFESRRRALGLIIYGYVQALIEESRRNDLSQQLTVVQSVRRFKESFRLTEDDLSEKNALTLYNRVRADIYNSTKCKN